MPCMMCPRGSAGGTYSPCSLSQRWDMAISSVCATTMRSHSTRTDWLAPCGGAPPAIRIADDVYIQSRDLKPLDRYFPELHAAFLERLPSGVVVDGEIVMPTKHGLDFGGLQMRLHPAASRVEKLAKAAPAAFVAFDLLAIGRKSLLAVPQLERRRQLEQLFKKIRRPLHLTPMTRDGDRALDWLQRFEGAGLDGVIAKPAGASYQPGH